METKETKGLRIRPRSMVPSQEYRDGWDRIFDSPVSSSKIDPELIKQYIELQYSEIDE